ncbi:CreA family protein [Arenibaculum pallidiluteum]|uniref:CreA family protein n=1 Tax=Arenibaculum pallidiluteum TaxID=2812559 RepID=UPI001A9616E1|nr:CreA family protein [Arenibaculum pallidiluteum]
MRGVARIINAASLALFLFGLRPVPALAEEVGRFSNDWTGNDLVVEAVADPKIEGVTCHIVRFDRSLIDRLSKGNWFEDPSNASIACRQTGPLRIGKIDLDRNGEEVFSDRISLIFKALAIRRIYDKPNDTLVYVIHSRQIVEGSAKMAISTVPLHGADVTWIGARP